jgi:uncharacterized protein YdeI (YjbR/CyaY-like superfamily)
METIGELPVLRFGKQSDWEIWLDSHFDHAGVWLKLAKKNTNGSSLSYADAVETALCYGWIDGQLQKYDHEYYIQRFTPRRARSAWSKINTDKVAQLIADNKMQPSGLRAVEAAKADGRWAVAYAPASGMTIHADLLVALQKNPQAETFYNTLSQANKYAIYYRLQSINTAAARLKKIETIVAMLERAETFH